MSKHVVIAAVILSACALPLLAQGTSGGSSETLSGLLSEVRALRLAVERAASTTPQVQLLTARLTVQNERLTRASREADAAHRDLGRVQSNREAYATEAAEIEDGLGRETDPAKQQLLKVRQRMLKQQWDANVMAEVRLRDRDTELTNTLAIEQGHWVELNRRFDELQAQLAGTPR